MVSPLTMGLSTARGLAPCSQKKKVLSRYTIGLVMRSLNSLDEIGSNFITTIVKNTHSICTVRVSAGRLRGPLAETQNATDLWRYEDGASRGVRSIHPLAAHHRPSIRVVTYEDLSQQQQGAFMARLSRRGSNPLITSSHWWIKQYKRRPETPEKVHISARVVLDLDTKTRGPFSSINTINILILHPLKKKPWLKALN